MLIGVVVWFPILKLFKTFLDLNKQISFFVAMKFFVFNRQNTNTLRICINWHWYGSIKLDSFHVCEHTNPRVPGSVKDGLLNLSSKNINFPNSKILQLRLL